MYIIGVDPGNRGAFALLDGQGNFIKSWIMPTQGGKFDPHGIASLINKMAAWASKFDSALLFGIEKIFAYSQGYSSGIHRRKVEGVKSMQSYGINYGVIWGCILSHGFQHLIIPPKTWQKELWVGTDSDRPPKERSLQAYRRLFPGQDEKLLPTERSRVAHDGIVDAVLIAEYTRRHCFSL